MPTQQKVAEAIGVKQQQYQLWESGVIRPEYKNLLRLSKYFGVPVSELFDKEELEEMNN